MCTCSFVRNFTQPVCHAIGFVANHFVSLKNGNISKVWFHWVLFKSEILNYFAILKLESQVQSDEDWFLHGSHFGFFDRFVFFVFFVNFCKASKKYIPYTVVNKKIIACVLSNMLYGGVHRNLRV